MKSDILSQKIGICRHCYKKPDRNKNIECKICTSILNPDCSFCSSRNVFFDELIYLRSNHQLEKQAIRKIKFSKKPYLSYLFRFSINQKIFHLRKINFSGIIYINSNKKTIKQRPYNPSFAIIEKLENIFRIPTFCPVIKTSKELQSSKSYKNRFLHARNAFRLLPDFKNNLSGNYLLIDDVFTTGATVNEIARIMKQNGANSVRVITLIKGDTG